MRATANARAAGLIQSSGTLQGLERRAERGPATAPIALCVVAPAVGRTDAVDGHRVVEQRHVACRASSAKPVQDPLHPLTVPIVVSMMLSDPAGGRPGIAAQGVVVSRLARVGARIADPAGRGVPERIRTSPAVDPRQWTMAGRIGQDADDAVRVREARIGRGGGGRKVNWADVLTALAAIAAILIPLMVMLRSIQNENRKAHEAINRNVREQVEGVNRNNRGQIEGVNRNIDRIYQLLSVLIGRGNSPG